MTDIADLLSWANLTSKLLGCTRDRALELAVDIQHEVKYGAYPNGEMLIGPSTADETEERRRKIMEVMLASQRKLDRREVASAIYREQMSDAEFERACEIVGSDLVYLRDQGMLEHKRPFFWPAKPCNVAACANPTTEHENSNGLLRDIS